MGAYAPTPLVDDVLYEKVKDRVIRPTLTGMKAEGAPFEGVLFIGIMVVNGEPITLEFNVRFGDPECEILMPLLKTPASELFYNQPLRLRSLSMRSCTRISVNTHISHTQVSALMTKVNYTLMADVYLSVLVWVRLFNKHVTVLMHFVVKFILPARNSVQTSRTKHCRLAL